MQTRRKTMFGRKKNSDVLGRGSRTVRGQSVWDLHSYRDTTAQQAFYVYERSNDNQQKFLNDLLTQYITVKVVYENIDDLDYIDERVVSRKVIDFNPPKEIKEKIKDLYLKMVAKNLPTRAEIWARQAKEEEESKRKGIDDGFNSFFDL